MKEKERGEGRRERNRHKGDNLGKGHLIKAYNRETHINYHGWHYFDNECIFDTLLEYQENVVHTKEFS